MKLIKKITRGEYTLEHSRHTDDFGFVREIFSLSGDKKSGMKMNYPFLPNMEVRDHNMNEPIGSHVRNFTKKQYEEIFNKAIIEFKKL